MEKLLNLQMRLKSQVFPLPNSASSNSNQHRGETLVMLWYYQLPPGVGAHRGF